MEGKEKRKDRNIRKSRSEEKVVGFSLASLFPARNGRQSSRVEPLNQGDRPTDVEENPRSQYRQRLGGQEGPREHSRYIHVKKE